MNLADLARAWPERRTPALDASISMLFLTAFGIKAGLFPSSSGCRRRITRRPRRSERSSRDSDEGWRLRDDSRFHPVVPRSNRGSVRARPGALGDDDGCGITRAIAEADFRRVLSFNLIGHIGFTTIGLALGTPAALGGSILYVLHHMLVITSLFLVSGLFLRQRRTTNLAALGGLYRTQPVVAALAMVPLFSLAGVPPLSGFIAKLAVIRAALAGDHYWVAAIALGVSLLTVLSMARLWDGAFWKPAPSMLPPRPLALRS